MKNICYKYVLAIAWYQVHYGKYLLSFSYFAIYFMSLWASEITTKLQDEKRGIYLPYCQRLLCKLTNHKHKNEFSLAKV